MMEVRNLSFAYGKGERAILDGVSFRIEPGDCVAILGVNGAGKSTLLKCLNRIQPATGGEVELDGQNVTRMSRRVLAQKLAYVPQHTTAAHTLVFDYVLLGRKPYIRWDVTKADKEKVQMVLKQYGLEDYASRLTSELSGGELQRVVLARAMAQEPEYLLLDEPTSNLDPRNQHEMMGAVRRITREQGIGAAIVMHDLNLAARYCNKFLFLKDARVFRFGGQEAMEAETIESVYRMPVQVRWMDGMPFVLAYPEVQDEA